VSLNSDINVWTEEEKPILTIRGHKMPVSEVLNFQNSSIISCDKEGRILAWNPATGMATRPSSVIKHKI